MFRSKCKLFVVAFLLLFLGNISNVKASTVLFQDNFSDPAKTYSQWTVDGVSNWKVEGGEYGIYLDVSNESNTYPSNDVWSNSWNDYDVQVDIIGTVGYEKSVAFRYQDSGHYYEVVLNDTAVYLFKHEGGGSISVPASKAYKIYNDQFYHIEISAVGSHIEVNINNEPLISLDDISNPILSGRIDLHALSETSVPVEVWYDNLVVTDLPTSTPFPTAVPNLKQYDPLWGTKIYDTANQHGSSEPYIWKWGCALTSATMILQKYGYDIAPGELNDWMNSYPNGYIVNENGWGQFNWLAVSDYTKTHKTTGQPSLEFKWIYSTSLSDLTRVLADGLPAILVEPGHFIVAVSQTSSGININDPAYSSRTTLDSYGNTFLYFGVYIPSYTDLSYIMLTIAPQYNIKVFSPSGSEISGNTFVQGPIVGVGGKPETTGDGIRYFMFPKPSLGNYGVQVTGNGTYELDSYLYDKDGNVNLNKTNGIIGNGESNTYQVTIGTTNSTKKIITIDTLIQDWNDMNKAGAIKLNSVYLNVYYLLLNAKKMMPLPGSKLAKTYLNQALTYIKVYTPKVIDLKYSTIIQKEIQDYLLTI